MSSLSLTKNYQKILVVGPIYERMDKLLEVEKLIPDYDCIIINGNLYNKYCNLDDYQKRLDVLDRMIKTTKVVFNMGENELMLIEGLLVECPDKIVNWLINRPNIIFVDFAGESSFVITAGGITPKMDKNKLSNNLETSFVSNIQGVPWHEIYNGRLGYVVSNNPLTLEPPKFYQYSAQIGNYHDVEHQVYAQEIDKLGLKRTICL